MGHGSLITVVTREISGCRGHSIEIARQPLSVHVRTSAAGRRFLSSDAANRTQHQGTSTSIITDKRRLLARVRALDCMAVSIVELQSEFRNQNLLQCPAYCSLYRISYSSLHIGMSLLSSQASIRHLFITIVGREPTLGLEFLFRQWPSNDNLERAPFSKSVSFPCFAPLPHLIFFCA